MVTLLSIVYSDACDIGFGGYNDDHRFWWSEYCI